MRAQDRAAIRIIMAHRQRQGQGSSTAPPPAPKEEEEELPYDGDLQAAMRAQEALRFASSWLTDKRQRPRQQHRPPAGSKEEEEELPYDGDLQAAMRAQDRAAIRIIMAHRQKAKTKPVEEAVNEEAEAAEKKRWKKKENRSLATMRSFRRTQR